MTVLIDLNATAKQSEFAEIVGVSQQAISQKINAGVLSKDGTYQAWLLEYCERLRLEAAGRGGSDQEALTRARTKQALADANMKELQFYRELKLLVPMEEIEPALRNWAAMARSEVQYAVEKLVSGIQSQHGIEVDQKLIDDTFTPAFRSVGSYPSQLAQDDGAGGEGVDSPAVAADAGMAG